MGRSKRNQRNIKFSAADLFNLEGILKNYDGAFVHFNNAGQFCIQGHNMGQRSDTEAIWNTYKKIDDLASNADVFIKAMTSDIINGVLEGLNEDEKRFPLFKIKDHNVLLVPPEFDVRSLPEIQRLFAYDFRRDTGDPSEYDYYEIGDHLDSKTSILLSVVPIQLPAHKNTMLIPRRNMDSTGTKMSVREYIAAYVTGNEIANVTRDVVSECLNKYWKDHLPSINGAENRIIDAIKAYYKRDEPKHIAPMDDNFSGLCYMKNDGSIIPIVNWERFDEFLQTPVGFNLLDDMHRSYEKLVFVNGTKENIEAAAENCSDNNEIDEPDLSERDPETDQAVANFLYSDQGKSLLRDIIGPWIAEALKD